jgi:hypothetical protein
VAPLSPGRPHDSPDCSSGTRATLAQSVEQLIRNQQVVGSNPTGGSKKIQGFLSFTRSVESRLTAKDDIDVWPWNSRQYPDTAN